MGFSQMKCRTSTAVGHVSMKNARTNIYIYILSIYLLVKENAAYRIGTTLRLHSSCLKRPPAVNADTFAVKQ